MKGLEKNKKQKELLNDLSAPVGFVTALSKVYLISEEEEKHLKSSNALLILPITLTNISFVKTKNKKLCLFPLPHFKLLSLHFIN